MEKKTASTSHRGVRGTLCTQKTTLPSPTWCLGLLCSCCGTTPAEPTPHPPGHGGRAQARMPRRQALARPAGVWVPQRQRQVRVRKWQAWGPPPAGWQSRPSTEGGGGRRQWVWGSCSGKEHAGLQGRGPHIDQTRCWAAGPVPTPPQCPMHPRPCGGPPPALHPSSPTWEWAEHQRAVLEEGWDRPATGRGLPRPAFGRPCQTHWTASRLSSSERVQCYSGFRHG